MNKSLHRVLADQAWRAASLDECPGTTAWKVLYEKKLIESVIISAADMFEVEFGTSEISGIQIAIVLKDFFGVVK